MQCKCHESQHFNQHKTRCQEHPSPGLSLTRHPLTQNQVETPGQHVFRHSPTSTCNLSGDLNWCQLASLEKVSHLQLWLWRKKKPPAPAPPTFSFGYGNNKSHQHQHHPPSAMAMETIRATSTAPRTFSYGFGDNKSHQHQHHSHTKRGCLL